jgi:hypothetical protein
VTVRDVSYEVHVSGLGILNAPMTAWSHASHVVAPVLFHDRHRAARAMPPALLLHEFLEWITLAGVLSLCVGNHLRAEFAPFAFAVGGSASQDLGEEILLSVQEVRVGAPARR